MIKGKTKYLIGFLFILVLRMQGLAQPSPNLTKADSITWDLYVKQDWRALRDAANEALKQGIDFYYLRMRLGIASLELNKAISAEKHFRQALRQAEGDETARQYLSLALHYQGKATEAGSQEKKLSEATRQKAGIKHGFRLLSAHADAGNIFRENPKGLDFDQLTHEEGIFGQEHFYDDNQFYDAGLYFLSGPAVQWYVGFQHIRIQATDRFAYQEQQLHQDSVVTNLFGQNYYYSLQTNRQLKDFRHELKQQAVYLQAQWAGSDRWWWLAALQLCSVKRDFTLPDYTTVTVTDTLFFDPTSLSLGLFDTEIGTTIFSDVSWSTTDYSFGLFSRYHAGLLSFSGGITLASVNDTSVTQLNAGYQLRPFGNLTLTHQGELIYLNHDQQQQLAYRLSLAWKPGQKILLEADLLAGKLNNLSEQYGYIVYNNPEVVNSRFEAGFSWLAAPHLQLQLRYRLHQYQRRYDYLSLEQHELKTAYYPTTSHTVIGGIIWIF